MKSKILLELLNELDSELSVVEPHGDMLADCAAHSNAQDLVSKLKLWANGEADLRLVKKAYFAHKETYDIEAGADEYEIYTGD